MKQQTCMHFLACVFKEWNKRKSKGINSEMINFFLIIYNLELMNSKPLPTVR